MWRSNGVLHTAVRLDTELRVFALDFEHSELRRVAVFPAPWRRWETARDAVAPDLSFAVFSGQHAIRATDQRGEVRWERRHDSWDSGSGSAAVTADGRSVWATVPGPQPTAAPWEYGGDEWLVLDAATGEQIGKATLDCAAAGSLHSLHPDATHVGLSVGEGQDGSPSYWGSLDNGTLTVRTFGDRDRALLDVAPDGRGFLTVQHLLGDVAVHDFADDAVTAEIDAAGLLAHAGHHVEDASFHYQAGYLTADTIIASAYEIHERGGSQEHQHWILDGRTLAPVGRVAYPTTPGTDLWALRDGTWLTADRDHVSRWSTA